MVASGVAFSMASQERAHGHRRVEVCASGHPVAPLSTARSYSLSQRLVAVARCPSRFRVRVIMNVMSHIPGKARSFDDRNFRYQATPTRRVLRLDVNSAPGGDSCLDAPPSYVMIDVVGAPMA